jgi:hypothetical protein
METLLLVLLVAMAASLCPATMWWQRRRGRAASCHMPLRSQDSAAAHDEADLEELRRRHEVITARIAELEHGPDRRQRPVAPSSR